MEKKIAVTRTPRKNTPCLWEEGGSSKRRGFAQILSNEGGGAPLSIFTKRHGQRAQGQHSLVPIKEGMFVIWAYVARDIPEKVEVFVISSIGEEEVTLKTFHTFEMGEWDTVPPSFLVAAVEAAVRKAACYHCREPHYIKNEGVCLGEDYSHARVGSLWEVRKV